MNEPAQDEQVLDEQVLCCRPVDRPIKLPNQVFGMTDMIEILVLVLDMIEILVLVLDMIEFLVLVLDMIEFLVLVLDMIEILAQGFDVSWCLVQKFVMTEMIERRPHQVNEMSHISEKLGWAGNLHC
jgi:hypothetical protein